TYFVQEAVPTGSSSSGGTAGGSGGLSLGGTVTTGASSGGWTQTGGNSGYGLTVGAGGINSGGTSTGNNFADFQNASITGIKYMDVTGNGFSADDTPLAGVTINLYQGTSATGTPIATTTTASDGTYSFNNLPPGTYFVQEAVPTGSSST